MYGLKHARGDFIIIMDADLSHHVRTPANRGADGCSVCAVHLLSMTAQAEMALQARAYVLLMAKSDLLRLKDALGGPSRV